MRPPLWYLFTVQAMMYALGFTLCFGVVGVVIVPPVVWLSIHQWVWPEFNRWLANTLVGVPIGVMTAGICYPNGVHLRQEVMEDNFNEKTRTLRGGFTITPQTKSLG